VRWHGIPDGGPAEHKTVPGAGLPPCFREFQGADVKVRLVLFADQTKKGLTFALRGSALASRFRVQPGRERSGSKSGPLGSGGPVAFDDAFCMSSLGILSSGSNCPRKHHLDLAYATC
jgi:hypothetical protein